MRSPYDTEDPKDIFRNDNMQEYMECTDIRIEKDTIGSFISFRRLCRFFRFKRKKKISGILGTQTNEEEYVMDRGHRRVFSFAEAELGRMGHSFPTDVAVQTGSSLEMQILNEIKINERMTQVDSDNEDIVARYEGKRRSVLDFEMTRNGPSDELSLLNFFRRARSVSMQISSSHAIQNAEIQTKYPYNTEEKEIQCLNFDHSIITPETVSVIATVGGITVEKPEAGLVKKKLRFEEQMTTIHVSDDDVEDEEVVSDQRLQRNIVYGSGKNLDDMDSNNNQDEPSTSTGHREFKSYFWGSSKNKPKKPIKKKTQHLSLR